MWDSAATDVAGNVRDNRYPFQRGLICIPCPSDGMVVAWLLGNDGFELRREVKRELELIRQGLKAAELEELGFGLSGDGHTWALALKADSQRYLTPAGKSLHLELLKIHLNDAILRAARQAACEFGPNRTGWAMDSCERVGSEG
jgi:hypothetical protein